MLENEGGLIMYINFKVYLRLSLVIVCKEWMVYTMEYIFAKV